MVAGILPRPAERLYPVAILSMQPSDLEIISRGARLSRTLRKVISRREGGQGLPPVRCSTLPGLCNGQYWLLCYWTEDFAELLHEAEDYASGAEWRQGVYWNVPERFDVTPMLGMIVQSDRLSEELGRKSAEAYIPLTVIVDNAGLNAEEKEFLKLLLYALLFTPDRVDDEKEMEEMNAKATAFLDNYPGSRYENYTRRYIRYRFRPSDWGMGSEFFLGYNQFTGGLSNHFTNCVIGGFAFDISYKKFTAYADHFPVLRRCRRLPSGYNVKGCERVRDRGTSLPLPGNQSRRCWSPCRGHRWDGDRSLVRAGEG